MQFTVIDRYYRIPETASNQAFLRVDNWNDYSFVTMFEVTLFDEVGIRHDMGTTKIGFEGQESQTATYSMLGNSFTFLPEQYFSVGQDVSYYINLSKLTEETKKNFLISIQDIVFSTEKIQKISNENVFNTSLLRSVSLTVIIDQYRRVLFGGVPLSDYDFTFSQPQSDDIAGIDLNFVVTANSLPSTNIHALIGRNGVGKTTLLNEMTSAVLSAEDSNGSFLTGSIFSRLSIPPGYFSSVVSVSFSAFDPFAPPQERADVGAGTRYSYIGLKDIEDHTGTLLKSLPTLRKECVASLGECFSDNGRKARWRNAIQTLESDENFARMDLLRLLDASDERLYETASSLVNRMSSGHAVVLLTISRLVSRVEEKTLVLLDEPESHLHPPLLSAFTRALSQLLQNRNGVAIVATHSPVVLQEVPRSCVYVITRSRLSMEAERPRIETFGENVGTLTREVFGLEVSQSGFHALLAEAVSTGNSYEQILASYSEQLGLEARGILRAMIADRDSVAEAN